MGFTEFMDTGFVGAWRMWSNKKFVYMRFPDTDVRKGSSSMPISTLTIWMHTQVAQARIILVVIQILLSICGIEPPIFFKRACIRNLIIQLLHHTPLLLLEAYPYIQWSHMWREIHNTEVTTRSVSAITLPAWPEINRRRKSFQVRYDSVVGKTLVQRQRSNPTGEKTSKAQEVIPLSWVVFRRGDFHTFCPVWFWHINGYYGTLNKKVG